MECPNCHTAVDATERVCPSCGNPLPHAGPDPLVGSTVAGRFRVVRLLGEGGMGAVYEAEQQMGTVTRKVALKTLHPHLSKDPKIQARFQRECGLIAELHHPNTIQVFDFGTTEDGRLFIAMEFVQGKSVATILEKEGPMPADRVERIFRQITGALSEAHQLGIVHRDLKPDNIVLTDKAGQKDWVEVLDFGIAKRGQEEDKAEQKLTQQGMVLGTPPYMSPEQFTGRPIDARSDIYSLGVMAYEMLTGQLPFQAQTAWEWATQHMTVQPTAIESHPIGARVPEPMRAAIRKALAKLPEDRFATVSDFFAAFSGAAPVIAHTAPDAGGGGRAKTEIGTPLDVNAAFGAPGGGHGAHAGHAGHAHALGGHPGGHAPAPQGYNAPHPQGPAQYGAPPSPQSPQGYGAQAAIPHAPPRGGKGGGKAAPLLIAAGVIGVISVGAIAFALVGSSSSRKDVDLGFDAAASQAPTAAPQTETPPSTASSSEAPPPLAELPETKHTAPPPKAGTGTKPPTAPSANPGTTPPTGQPPATNPPATNPPATNPPTTTPPPVKPPVVPPPPPTPAVDPPICKAARATGGRDAKLVAACRAQGGKI